MEAGTFLGMYSGELITEAIGESRKCVYRTLSGTFANDERHPGYTTNTAEPISLICEVITMWWMPST